MSSADEPIAKEDKFDSEPFHNKTIEFDEEVQKVFEALDDLQYEIDGLNENASEEILQVEQKYNKLRKPHYDKRPDFIKNIPNFWIKAFVNNRVISAILDEEEEECLHYLVKVEVEESDDIKSGYRIKMWFDDNPFFENQCLTKEFALNRVNPTSTSTTIKWKEGWDLLKRQNEDTTEDSNSPTPRSFFGWFTNNTLADSDEIAEVIKDEIWPNPLRYFLLPDFNESMEGDDDGPTSAEGNSDEDEEEDKP